MNWSDVAGEVFEETLRRKKMREAAEALDKFRKSTRTPGWREDGEIRQWRDTRRKL